MLTKILSAARGDRKADLVLKNARIVNLFTREIVEEDLAIDEGFIAGIGSYSGNDEIDLNKKLVLPGLIDGHLHLESSMMTVGEYAKVVIPRGITSIVIDPHEIANVCGVEGIEYLIESSHRVPLNVFIMASSCVPASPLETSMYRIEGDDLAELLDRNEVLGLAEVMNFPSVIEGDADMLDKIMLARHKVVDGHAPGLKGKQLNAYIAAGIGSDHECTELSEAKQKLGLGMQIMIRESSVAKNLDALLPLAKMGLSDRCSFVSDDKEADDLLSDGSVDSMLRRAIGLGLDPFDAISMASLNTARYLNLRRVGSLAPGNVADFIVSSDLYDIRAEMVFKSGLLVAEGGRPFFEAEVYRSPVVEKTVRLGPISIESFNVKGESGMVRVIGVVRGQAYTRALSETLAVEDGLIKCDPERDISKVVVVERHKRTGNVGKAFVKGFGLRRGAFGSTVAHDAHNLIVVGTNNQDIYEVVKEIERMDGGMAVVEDLRVRARLSLPIAGLMSYKGAAEVSTAIGRLEKSLKKLGVHVEHPFIILSFLALSVIPELKVTDLGLVDVARFDFVPVELQREETGLSFI